MKGLFMWVFGLVIFAAFMYGMYFVFKSVSYFFFYEGFVQQTITEMVRPEYLK